VVKPIGDLAGSIFRMTVDDDRSRLSNGQEEGSCNGSPFGLSVDLVFGEHHVSPIEGDASAIGSRDKMISGGELVDQLDN